MAVPGAAPGPGAATSARRRCSLSCSTWQATSTPCSSCARWVCGYVCMFARARVPVRRLDGCMYAPRYKPSERVSALPHHQYSPHLAADLQPCPASSAASLASPRSALAGCAPFALLCAEAREVRRAPRRRHGRQAVMEVGRRPAVGWAQDAGGLLARSWPRTRTHATIPPCHVPPLALPGFKGGSARVARCCRQLHHVDHGVCSDADGTSSRRFVCVCSTHAMQHTPSHYVIASCSTQDTVALVAALCGGGPGGGAAGAFRLVGEEEGA